MIATPLTVWIMTLFGWKTVFYFYGALGFLWAGAWLLYSTERPSEHKGMTDEDLREIEASQSAEEGVSVGDDPIRSKAVWGLTTAYFCFTYTWWLFLNWLPTYLVQARGFTVIKMGFFASLPWLAALVSSNGAGWLSDVLVKRGFSTGTGETDPNLFWGTCHGRVPLAGHPGKERRAAVALITATILLAGPESTGLLEPAYRHERAEGRASSPA